MSTRKRRSIFDVFEEIRDEMDRFLEEAIEPMTPEFPMYDVSRRELQPLIHLYTSEENVVVTMDLPCVRKEDIRLHVTENALKVEASMRECVRLRPWGPPEKEAEFDVFRKTVRLPTPVDAKKAKAKFKNGILEVTLPRKILGVRILVE